MRRLRFFWLYFLLINRIEIAHSQSIILKGIVLDDSTNFPVSEATIRLLNKENRLLRSTMTSQKGDFTFQNTEHIHTLEITKSGYYPFHTEIYFSGSNTNDFQPNFYVPIKLSRIPAQNYDKPYEQQTQHHFELGKDTVKGVTFSRKFTFINSETNRPVKAELCLIPTRTGRRECVSVPEEGYNASFEGMDITALEVKSDGFNDFYGNLVLTRSEKPNGEYRVRLRPVRALISIATAFPTDSIYIVSGSPDDHFLKINAHLFFLSTPKIGRILLKIATFTGNFQQSVYLQSGLHLIGLSDRTDTVNSETVCEVLHRGEQIKVYFPQSSYELSAEAKELLDQLANCKPSRMIFIVGHTESIGNEKLNKTLSEFRAKVVASYLIRKGVWPSQLHDSGVGSTQPTFPDQRDRSQNRRVEIFLQN